MDSKRQWSASPSLFVVRCLADVAFSFEDALLAPEVNPIMTQILARFVLNLRPQTRNLR